LILVDTSAWIDFFRGKDPLATLVDDALETGEAALCGPVLMELRRGFKTSRERTRVLPLLDSCDHLIDPDDLWIAAGDLGFALGRQGVTVKSLDLLIAAIAIAHNVPILTGDRDFERMRGAGVLLIQK
jgi:tRNA(fMet)-specific endonuclease VapC